MGGTVLIAKCLLMTTQLPACAEFVEEAAARRFFAEVPAAAPRESPPLALASTVGARLFGPSTQGDRISYYLFDAEHLFEVDLETDEVRSFPQPVRRKSRVLYQSGVASAQFGPDGRLYYCLAGGPSWFGRFDPRSRTFESLGELKGYTPARWLWRPDGFLYIVNHPATLGRLHLGSAKCENLGKLGLRDAFNIQGKVGIDDDGWFHCRTGYVPRDIAFNVHTREHRLLADPWKPRLRGPDGTAAQKPVAIPNYGKGYEVYRWQHSDKKRPSDGQHFFRYRRRGEKEWRDIVLKVATTERSLDTIGLGPEGKLYGCAAYHSFCHDPKSGKTERFTFGYNVYAYLPVGPILYMQGYPNCRLVALDTRQPRNTKTVWSVHSLEQANPWQVENYSDRPPKKGSKEPLWLKRGRQLALGYDGRVFTAGTGERYLSGGAIAWTDPKTGITDCFREPFEFLPVSALKSIDGGRKMAGATWVQRHHGKKVPQPREATVFLYDVEGNKLDFMVPVSDCNAVQDLLPVSAKRWVGLAIRDVELWDGDPLANTRSVVFFFDPESRKVTTQIDVPFSLARRVGLALIPAPDGTIWAAANLAVSSLPLLNSEDLQEGFGGLVRIDPEKETVTPIFRATSPGNFLFVGNTMYLCGAPGLRTLDVSRFLERR